MLFRACIREQVVHDAWPFHAEEELRDRFGHYDVNDDGMIDRAELNSMLTSLGVRER